MTDLKSTYRKHLISFATLNILLFFSAVYFSTGNGNLNFTFESLTKSSLYLAISPILVVVINGWISADLKAMLVFWKIKNPLPGSRAFISPIIDDPRINIDSLRVAVGGFPTEPLEQNRLWYRLMKQEGSDSAISQSHRDWLFTRDLTGYSFTFLLIFATGSILFVPSGIVMISYIIFLVTQYLLVVFSARTYGIRFVKNVLAKSSTNS